MTTLNAHPLSRKVHAGFITHFGHAPQFLVHAPGRINLIGEHTDYNAGFVLPGAIPKGIFFALSLKQGGMHAWQAMDTGEGVQLPADIVRPADRGWQDYFLGACDILRQQYGVQGGIRCVFASDLPAGAGLSSSSALTCGFLLGLNALYGLNIERSRLAWLAHLVEREFIGLQGGIMDQQTCLLGKSGHLLLLDCLDRSFRYIPFPGDALLDLFLINTQVQHKLMDTDYNVRAAECRHALQLLQQESGINTLRDITPNDLPAYKSLLGPVLLRRVRFVLEENDRVASAVRMIETGHWRELGHLLLASHAGLRDVYEVSCKELDFLVDAVSEFPHILGARMMGGGFGGCTIQLARHSGDPGFRQKITAMYLDQFGRAPEFIDIGLSDGAQVWRPEN